MEVEGKKFDNGKTKMGMVFKYFSTAFTKIAECGTYGWRKYAKDTFWDYNWHRLSNPKERYTDALFRHLMKWLRGHKVDKESGLSHLAHAAWCLCALIEHEEGKLNE